MNTMRANMAAIMIGLAVVFLLTMSVGGLVGGANIMDILAGKHPQAFTVVNGEEISYEDFARRLQQEQEAYRQRNGKAPDDRTLARLTDQVWENMVTQTLLRQEVKRRGIKVSEDELRYYFTENIHPVVRQYFTDDKGQFDYQKYQQAVSSPQAAGFFNAAREQVAEVVPIEKLQRRILATVHVSEGEVWSEFLRENTEMDLEYLLVNSSSWKDNELDVTDEDVANYYDLHKDDYHAPETRELDYISFFIQPTQEDTQRIINRLLDIKDEIAHGEKFEDLAAAYSDDPSSTNGGYLGWFGRGRMVPPFEKAAFQAEVGEVVGPVKTRFGFHLIKILNKRKKDGKEEVEARHILLKVVPSSSTKDALRRKLKNVEFLAEEIGFKRAADSLGFKIKHSNKLRAMDNFIAGLGPFQEAVRFAFTHDTTEVSKVLENDTHYALFQLVKINPEGIRSLSEVKASIRRKLLNDARVDAAMRAADSLRQRLDSTSKLATVTLSGRKIDYRRANKVKAKGPIPGLGTFNNVLGWAISAPLNEVSPPLETPRGAVLLRVLNRTQLDSAAYANQQQEIYQKLLKRRQNETWNEFISDLKKKAEIEDNRVRFL